MAATNLLWMTDKYISAIVPYLVNFNLSSTANIYKLYISFLNSSCVNIHARSLYSVHTRLAVYAYTRDISMVWTE